jgi:hypothetical protein
VNPFIFQLEIEFVNLVIFSHSKSSLDMGIGDGVNLSDSHTHPLRCHHNSVMVTIADKRSLIDLFMFRALAFVWLWFSYLSIYISISLLLLLLSVISYFLYQQVFCRPVPLQKVRCNLVLGFVVYVDHLQIARMLQMTQLLLNC